MTSARQQIHVTLTQIHLNFPSPRTSNLRTSHGHLSSASFISPPLFSVRNSSPSSTACALRALPSTICPPLRSKLPSADHPGDWPLHVHLLLPAGYLRAGSHINTFPSFTQILPFSASVQQATRLQLIFADNIINPDDAYRSHTALNKNDRPLAGWRHPSRHLQSHGKPEARSERDGSRQSPKLNSSRPTSYRDRVQHHERRGQVNPYVTKPSGPRF